MARISAIVLMVGSFVISTSGCHLAESRPDIAKDARNPRMPVSEHAVHYLEIVTPDAQATADFYAKAYGWQFAPAAPELGNALVAALPDGSLCGIRAPMHEQEKPVVRTYLRVADIDAAARRAADLGAVLALEPTELPGRGRIAIFLLGGIEQGLWQL